MSNGVVKWYKFNLNGGKFRFSTIVEKIKDEQKQNMQLQLKNRETYVYNSDRKSKVFDNGQSFTQYRMQCSASDC